MKTASAIPRQSVARREEPPRIWQVCRVPSWDRVFLEIYSSPKLPCVGFEAECYPGLLFLNMSPTSDGDQIYQLVRRNLVDVDCRLVESFHVELRCFDQLEWTWARLSRLRLDLPNRSMRIDVAIESPGQHRARGVCPFCFGACLERSPKSKT